MKIFLIYIIIVFMIAKSTICVVPLSYLNQDAWKGQCQDYQFQSPIDIPKNTDTIVTHTSIFIEDAEYSLLKNIKKVEDNHTRMNLDYDTVVDDFIIINVQGISYKYTLTNVHFHCPSEHTFNGVHSNCELHMVHQRNLKVNDKDPRHTFVVVGILINNGTNIDNQLFSDADIDLSPYVSRNNSYYHYSGGLTTPPCSELVNWFVYSEVVEATPDQVQQLVDMVQFQFPETGDNRKVQPLGNRHIYLVSPSVSILIKVNTILIIMIAFLLLDL